MNWQTPVALGIVALVVVAFLWHRFRPRRFSLTRDTACGCASRPGGAKPPGYIVHGRRGEPQKVTLKP
jgi:hypothetical protein